MAGGSTSTGASAKRSKTIAVAAELVEVDPPALVALTITRMVLATSALFRM
jgi:hypothetical protein